MIIATRSLTVREAGVSVEIPIRLCAPERLSDQSWSCRYEIGWPDKLRTATAGGVDSMQALFIALQMIGSEIYTTNYHKAGTLFLEHPGGGYGFPVPTTLRDMLTGDDKKFV